MTKFFKTNLHFYIDRNTRQNPGAPGGGVQPGPPNPATPLRHPRAPGTTQRTFNMGPFQLSFGTGNLDRVNRAGAVRPGQPVVANVAHAGAQPIVPGIVPVPAPPPLPPIIPIAGFGIDVNAIGNPPAVDFSLPANKRNTIPVPREAGSHSFKTGATSSAARNAQWSLYRKPLLELTAAINADDANGIRQLGQQYPFRYSFNDIEPELRSAIQNNKILEVRKALTDLLHEDRDREKLLKVAAERNDVGLVKHLLANGVVPREFDESTFIPRIRRLLATVRDVHNNTRNPTKEQLNDAIAACNGPPKFVRKDFLALEHTIITDVGELKLTMSDFARQRMVALARQQDTTKTEPDLGDIVELVFNERVHWRNAQCPPGTNNQVRFDCEVSDTFFELHSLRVFMSYDPNTNQINGVRAVNRHNWQELVKVTDTGDNSLIPPINLSWKISDEALALLPQADCLSTKDDRDELRTRFMNGLILKKEHGTKIIQGTEAQEWWGTALNKAMQFRTDHELQGQVTDLIAIHLYTHYAFEMNRACRQGDLAKLETLKPYMRCLASGLNQLGPEFAPDGPLYRGVRIRRDLIDVYKSMIGETIVEPAITSASENENFQWRNSNVLFIIRPKKKPADTQEAEQADAGSSTAPDKGKAVLQTGDGGSGSRARKIDGLSKTPSEGESVFPFLGNFKIDMVLDTNPAWPASYGEPTRQFPLATIILDEV